MKKTELIKVFVILPLLFLSFVKPLKAQEEEAVGTSIFSNCVFGAVGISENCKIDLLAGHRAILNMGKRVTNEASEEIQKLMYKMMYSLFANTLTEFAPEIIVQYDDPNLGDLGVPKHMEYGLAGAVDRHVAMAINSYPSVDVAGHLAMEWIPGHKATQTIYAGGYEDLQAAKIDVLWSKTRNIAYLGYVVIMIVIGFMIMFRNKIGGQALVTLGNSIPKIVVGLILVTFSFAIVGLVIDFGGVLMRVVGGMIEYQGGYPWNFIQLFQGTLFAPGYSPGNVPGINSELTGVKILDISLGLILALNGYGTGIGADSHPAGGLFFLVVAILVLCFVTFAAIKLWFTLIKTYMIILASTVIGPISIMFGSLPGNQHITTNWFKALFRNVLVFPVAYAIINLPGYLASQGASFDFPSSFYFQESTPVELTGNYWSNLMLIAVKILAIFVAAQTPKLLAGIIPPTASRAGSDAGQAIKQSLSKVPLVGGMFKG